MSKDVWFRVFFLKVVPSQIICTLLKVMHNNNNTTFYIVLYIIGLKLP